ncbi:MAG: hypothetical protein JNK82_38695 [Myxococcaceae bacterium]|nr:hypothetical protein [Myxococcaceae bacterium]
MTTPAPTARRDQQLAGAVWGLGVALPGLCAAGVFPGFDLLPLPAWLLIAAAAGAAGTLFGARQRRGLAATLGAIGGAGCLFTIPLYVELRSQVSSRFFTLELLLPAALVALPLLGVWRAVNRTPVAPKAGKATELMHAAERTVEAPDRALCARHPQTVARWACGRCGSFFCPLCARYPAPNGKPLCEACAPSA